MFLGNYWEVGTAPAAFGPTFPLPVAFRVLPQKVNHRIIPPKAIALLYLLKTKASFSNVVIYGL